MPNSAFWLLFLLPSFPFAVDCVDVHNLLGGRFNTTTDVQGILNFALDIARLAESNNTQEKINIFQNGGHAYELDGNGNMKQLSLSSLGFFEESEKGVVANTNRWGYSLIARDRGDAEGTFAGRPLNETPNTIVFDFIMMGIKKLDTDAALLFLLLNACTNALEASFHHWGIGNTQMALAKLDIAAAYWIGDSKGKGVGGQAVTLYQHADNAGSFFNQYDGESKVNNKIIDSFVQIQRMIRTVQPNEQSRQSFWNTLHDLIGLLNVPALQNAMVFATSREENAAQFSELYRLSLMPRILSCNPSEYEEHLNFRNSANAEDPLSTIHSIQRCLSCFRVSCLDVGDLVGETSAQCNDVNYAGETAGYPPTDLEFFTTDRDLLQLDIQLEWSSPENALHIYSYGYSSSHSLRSLAATPLVVRSTMGQTNPAIHSLLQSSILTVAHDYILEALNQEGTFRFASASQARHAVLGLARFGLIFSSIPASLRYSVEKCQNSQYVSATSLWNKAAGYIIGALHPSQLNAISNVRSLFDINENMCSSFRTCNGQTGRSIINEKVVAAASDSLGFVSSPGKCSDADSALEATIFPLLPLSLFQVCVEAGVTMEETQSQPTAGIAGTGFAVAQVLMTMIKSVNPGGAELMRDFFSIDRSTDNPIPFSSVIDVLRDALPRLRLDCGDVGSYRGDPVWSLCLAPPTNAPIQEQEPLNTHAPTQVPTSSPSSSTVSMSPSFVVPSSTPITTSLAPTIANRESQAPTVVDIAVQELAYGRYTFMREDIARGFASFALDVQVIRQTNNISEALLVYTNGRNAVASGFPEEVSYHSLSALSTDAAIYMNEDPIHSFYKYALYSEGLFAEESSYVRFSFADEVVQEAFYVARDPVLAADAIVALTVWSMIIHKLEGAIQACSKRAHAYAYVDAAVALWVGVNKEQDTTGGGWLMYAAAQSANHIFGNSQGEAPVNTKLMTAFNNLQRLTLQCPVSRDVHLDVRSSVREVVRLLSVPLIQHLFHSIALDDQRRVELYSMASVPQMITCHPSGYNSLSKTLFAGFHAESLDLSTLDGLASLLSCLNVPCEDLGLATTASPQLAYIVNSVCHRLEQVADLEVPGYSTTWETQSVAALQIDRDIRSIDILLSTGAQNAATDFYKFGHNSHHRGETESLQGMALASEFEESLIWSTFYKDDLYIDNMVIGGMMRTGDFRVFAPKQRRVFVLRLLQNMVLCKGILTRLLTATEQCGSSDNDSAVVEWETALALFIGSLQLTSSETLLKSWYTGYPLSQELCPIFQNCGSGDLSSLNAEILATFQTGRELLHNGRCSELHHTLVKKVFSLIQGPPLLGFLASSFEASGDVPDKVEEVSAYAYSRSLAPVVSAANETSGNILLENFFVDGISDAFGFHMAFESVAGALEGLGIECHLLGRFTKWHNQSLCTSSADRLPWRMYRDLYDGHFLLPIGEEVESIRHAADRGDSELALDIYTGREATMDPSIHELALSMRSRMASDPAYSLFTYGLRVVGAEGQDADPGMRADSFVKDAINTNSPASISASIVVSMNIWMEVSHLASMIGDFCRTGKQPIERTVRELLTFWVGDLYTRHHNGSGNLLFELAEKTAGIFQTRTQDDSIAKVNEKLLHMLNATYNLHPDAELCNDDSFSTLLYAYSQKIQAQVTVPLIQSLVDSIQEKDPSRTHVYANAVLPMVSACSNSHSIQHMWAQLVSTTEDERADLLEEVLRIVRHALPCLGMSCQQVGIHPKESSAVCAGIDDGHESLAGYQPLSSSKLAVLDLDVLWIDRLADEGAVDAAKDVYRFGRQRSLANGDDSVDIPSLLMLAADSNLSVNVKELNTVKTYYGSHFSLDAIVNTAFDESDKGLEASQRAPWIMQVVQSMITRYHVLMEIHQSEKDCLLRSNGIVAAWDKAAALTIGSLASNSGASSSQSYFMFGLAQEQCKNFGTCSTATSLSTAGRIVQTLRAGRDAAESYQCEEVGKLRSELSSLLLVPLIQALIDNSAKLSLPHPPSSALPRSQVIAQSLVPLVAEIDTEAAGIIEETIDKSSAGLSETDIRKLFYAFSRVYEGLGVDCALVGKYGSIHACHSFDEPNADFSDSSSLNKSSIAIIVVCVCALLVAILSGLLCWRRRRRLQQKDKETYSKKTNLSKRIGATDDSFFESWTHETSSNSNSYCSRKDMGEAPAWVFECDDSSERRTLLTSSSDEDDVVV